MTVSVEVNTERKAGIGGGCMMISGVFARHYLLYNSERDVHVLQAFWGQKREYQYRHY